MKIFKRYQQEKTLGIISSGIILSRNDSVLTSALTDVVSWSTKLGTCDVLLAGEQLVTCMAKHEDYIAIGYANGTIRLFGKNAIVFNGHRSAITSLAFDGRGVRLASGSSDTDIVLWDIVSEEGLVRFKGHKDQISCIAFIEGFDRLERLNS